MSPSPPTLRGRPPNFDGAGVGRCGGGQAAASAAGPPGPWGARTHRRPRGRPTAQPPSRARQSKMPPVPVGPTLAPARPTTKPVQAWAIRPPGQSRRPPAPLRRPQVGRRRTPATWAPEAKAAAKAASRRPSPAAWGGARGGGALEGTPGSGQLNSLAFEKHRPFWQGRFADLFSRSRDLRRMRSPV